MKEPLALKNGDRVKLTFDERTVDATVRLASANGISLMLEFEAILDGHVGMMPVLFFDGEYRALVTGTLLEIHHVQ